MAKKKHQSKPDAPADTGQAPKPGTPDTPGEAAETKPTSKSESIRQVLLEMGMDTPAEKVREVLAEKGIEVSPATVYQTKARMPGGKRARTGDGGRKRVDDDYEELLNVKELANDVGGLERLKHLCDVLLRLQQE